jgi:anti-sigma regulatory factor (Ser/Thr protein kinase)
MARVVQMSTLPAQMPTVPGYSAYGTFEPAALTGGDAFDLCRVADELLVVLADATGHGLAPALSVTQLQAMLRVAFRLGTSLDDALLHVNNQLDEWLPDDRFITAFVGLLDPASHRLRYHSAGQAPILHFRASAGDCDLHKPTGIPLGALTLARLRPAAELALEPGDMLVLLSDGIYEFENAAGEPFGVDRVRSIVRLHQWKDVDEIARVLLAQVRAFAGKVEQQDDITIVLVRRDPAMRGSAYFERQMDGLRDIVTFTAAFFARESIDATFRQAVDLTVEELFTNMVKYSRSSESIRIDMTRIDDGVEVAITDYDVDPFDVTKAPDADVSLPIERRKPGGLGLHLIRRLVDTIEYEYVQESRRSRITFRKTSAGSKKGGPAAGGDFAAH